ncbi:MAG: hypothetical protein HWE13_15205 [Gammaproteobacteria bacterium]|nr:hypothetical protein [Gammaproteobacteria bacterium]
MAASKSALNQRQWLTVIMLATAFMILLFTIIGKIFEQRAESQLAVSHAYFADINAITLGDWTVRLLVLPDGSQECRDNANLLSATECSAYIDHWRQLQPQAILNQTDTEGKEFIAISLERQTRTEQWRFYPNALPRLVNLDTQTTVFLSNQQVRQLFPERLLKHWR